MQISSAIVMLLAMLVWFSTNQDSAATQSLSLQRQTNNNMTLFGDAFFMSNDNTSFSLTKELSTCRFPQTSTATTEFLPFHGNGVGRAVYARPIRFLDPTTNTTSSFSSTFTFSIVPSPLCSGGDGIAFLIAPDAVPDSAAAAKGHIGLPGPPISPQDSFFAVEFDTSFDPLLGDASANHVGLDLGAAVSVAASDVFIDLKSGRAITAWVEYRGPVGLVRVWLGYSPEPRPRNPVVVAEVDLSDVFNEFMYVGFSGSNGHGSSLHVVKNWKFKTFQFHSATVLPIDEFEEGDCFICSLEDSLETSSSASPSTSASTEREDKSEKTRLSSGNVRLLRDMVLGIGGLIALLFSVLAIGGVTAFLVMKKRRLACRRRTRVDCSVIRLRSKRVPAKLSLAEIWAATMGFDRDRIVGVGASATVYKGSLPFGGGEVAVKRFRIGSGEGGLVACSSRNRPFNNEFATVVGCLRHKNLVQLQGWCCEGSELVLVYEYMPNGSLDKILHNRADPAAVLSWKQRLNIVLGVASALAYLHEECEKQIIHRDVKTCNIMLDAEFNAKLGDFGLAEVLEGTSSSGMPRRGASPAGTVGYLAPEYVCSGVASAKTDVYSFGVVVLEVGTGRRAMEEDGDGATVVNWAWGLWERGRLGEAVDPRLKGRPGEREVERMLVVGLACVHPNHLKRPTAAQAARILRQEVPLPALPARRPRLRLRSLLPDVLDELPSLDDDDSYLTPRSQFI